MVQCREKGDNNNDMLLGVWLSSDADERWTFNSDDTFENEMPNGTWTTFMEGTFSYNDTSHRLTLDSGSPLVMDLLLNESVDRMAQGVDALRGGDTSTLLGTWEGEVVYPGATHTRTWTFTAGGAISYHEVITGLTDDSASGDVAIDTLAKTFTVSSSTDTSVLDNGEYNYMVIGEGVTVSDNPGEALEYFNKL